MAMGNDLSHTLPGPTSHTSRLPLLVDICLTVSQIVILLVAAATAILSILANVDFLTIILRTGVAIVCIGLPVYVLNYLVGHYYVEATLADLKRAFPESKPKSDLENVQQSELETDA